MNTSLRAFAVLTVVSGVTAAGAWQLLPGTSYVARADDPAPTASADPDPSPPADPVTSEPEPTEEPKPQPKPQPKPAPEPEPVLQPGPTILGPGDEGPAVRKLQARLRQIDWFSGDVTDHYGDVTEEAVRGFQAKRGFPVTGAVDRRTMDRLVEMSHEPTAAELSNAKPDPADGAPLDERCLTGEAICVDKSSSSLRWVVDGKVKLTLDARFGGNGYFTREGLFHVERKSRDHVSSLYDTSMPFAMFFSKGQAVHYSPDFAANGYNGASHGCVNTRDYDGIAWLYDQVDLGDKVVVYWSRPTQLDPTGSVAGTRCLQPAPLSLRQDARVDERMAELVLRAAELIPPGRVASYGDLAGLCGTSARHVGQIMARYGSGVPWWRVTNHSGDLPRHLREEVAVHWAREGITWKPNRLGCRISDFRADLVGLADAYASLPPLPEPPG